MQPPSVISAEHWPPNYVGVLAWRQAQATLLSDTRYLIPGAKAYYRDHPVEFIIHWCDTFDPRNAGTDVPTRLPFVLFPRQADLVEFLLSCVTDEADGLIEKCRDMGATWTCAAFSVWMWLFWEGAAIGWGSRKEQLVDKIGDPDSIFEKMRMIVQGLPRFFYPDGFVYEQNTTYMKFVNPELESTITGEAGDSIGRGGRKRMYFKDESAHYEHPEKIEAALGDNTRCQIDISSVNGLGNVFHRRRESGEEWAPGKQMTKGKVRVFVMDWTDHPAKTQAWYDERRAKFEGEGLLHVFSQEVDRSYSASVLGVIIELKWVKAAIDAHVKLGFGDEGMWCSALDVADGGNDVNAQTNRRGVVLKFASTWGERDTGVTTRKALQNIEKLGSLELQYDSIGIGSGVKAETNRLKDENLLPRGVRLIPWNAGGAVLNPDKRVIEGDRDSPLNKDFYGNIKAQGWWELRNRLERTWRAVTEGVKYAPHTLISFDSAGLGQAMLRLIEKELCQPTIGKNGQMKLIVNKQPEGTRSPNIADSIMMNYWPAKSGSYTLAGIDD